MDNAFVLGITSAEYTIGVKLNLFYIQGWMHLSLSSFSVVARDLADVWLT